MWYRKGSVKTSVKDRAKNEVLQSVKENRNILTYLLTYSMEQSPS
jgi:hypothetical protein